MWAKLHDDLPDHPKIIRLSLLMKMDRDLVRGKLERLWLWALTNRVDGILSEDDIEVVLPDVMRLGKISPRKMIEALVGSRLLDPTEGGYIIHDWDEHAGLVKAAKETSKAKSNDRVKRYRERQKALQSQDDSVTCNALQSVTDSVTVTPCNAPRKDKIRKDKNNDIMTDTTSILRAREQDELSTGCGKLESTVDGLWMLVLAEEPTESEVKLVSRFAYGMEYGAVRYALELACMYGANNVAAYAAKVLNEWRLMDITTEDAARAWREAQEA